MSIAKLTTGDDAEIPVQLYKVSRGIKEKFIINGSATIKASVVSMKRKSVILDPVLVTDATLGDDWFTSLVKVRFTESATAAIRNRQLGTALLEIQVDDGGKLTWYLPIELRKGTIDQ